MSNLISNANVVKRDSRKRVGNRHTAESELNRNLNRNQKGRWGDRFSSEEDHEAYKLVHRQRCQAYRDKKKLEGFQDELSLVKTTVGKSQNYTYTK